MKNEKVLAMLNENKIEELKQMLMCEIGLEDNKTLPTYKAIQKLSKIAEKNQRGYRFNITHNYKRPALAGAFYVDNKTTIMSEAWGILLDGKISGLIMAEDNVMPVRLDKVIPSSKDIAEEYEPSAFDKCNLNDIKNKLKINKEHSIILGNNKYPANQFVNLYECLEDAFLYIPKYQYKPLIIKGTNGTAIICALRY